MPPESPATVVKPFGDDCHIMREHRLSTLLVVIGFAVLAIAMTWPLSRPGEVSVPDSDDVYFSTWRISWVAHQLPIDPLKMFDANIFYPEKNTFAFSDAMLLVGIVAAPFLWLGIEPTVVHNGLLIFALFSSAVGAYSLARSLGASFLGGTIAGITFGFAPYRFAHIGHLELQWVLWMPLAMITLQKLAARPSPFSGILLGCFVVAQTFSSIYYGAFLCLYLAAATAIEFFRSTKKASLAYGTMFAFMPLALVIAIYGPPYAKTRAIYGGRSGDEQQRYSASLSDFSRVPPLNKLRGNPNGGIAPDERSLYVGAAPMALAVVALLPPISAAAVTYATLGLVAADGSLGSNGLLFPVIQRIVPTTSSFRSPARFGVLVLLSVAMLAAIGLTRLNARWPRARRIVSGAAAAICVVEYWSAPLPVRPFDTRPSPAHEFLAQQPPNSIVLELPVPTLESLWLYETTYQVRSIDHWQPLVNGYSAFAPESYRETLELLRTFPSQQSISHLQKIGVRFILINRTYYNEEQFMELIRRVSERDEFWPPRAFGTNDNQIIIAEFKRPK